MAAAGRRWASAQRVGRRHRDRFARRTAPRPRRWTPPTHFLDRYLAAERPDRPHRRGRRHGQRGAGLRHARWRSPSATRSGFRLIWAWTDEHLQRDDGLLAWRWADGGIVDYQAAADADLLAAAALALAGRRFGDADLIADARLINDAVLAHEVAALGAVAGARRRPVGASRSRTVNASYLATPAMSLLWESLGEQRWGPVATWSRRFARRPHGDRARTCRPTGRPSTPPGASPRRSRAHAGDPPRYGYEAARVIVQAAVDCSAAGQDVAAAGVAVPRRRGGWRDVGGDVHARRANRLGADRHPLALVAAAAAAAASERVRTAAADLLDDADALDERAPSYFGAAWIALGRLWLDTDLLGGCRPGLPTR